MSAYPKMGKRIMQIMWKKRADHTMAMWCHIYGYLVSLYDYIVITLYIEIILSLGQVFLQTRCLVLPRA